MNQTPCVDTIKAKSENPVFAYIIEQFANNEILLTGTFNNGHNYTFKSYSGLDSIHLRKVVSLITFRTEVEDRLKFELHYNFGRDSLRCNYITYVPNTIASKQTLMACSDGVLELMASSVGVLDIINVSKLSTEESHFQQMTKHDCSGVHPDDIKILLDLFNKCREMAENAKC